MRLIIDSDLCQGHAQCWGIVPDLVELDEQGFAHAASEEIEGETLERARRAAAGCPERAIRVVD